MSTRTIHSEHLAAAVLVLALGLSSGAPALAGERPLKGGEIKPEVIYHNYCSVCHGDRGDGNSRAKNSLVPPPRDFTKATNLTRDYIMGIVAEGKPGTAMVSWKSQLTPKEIEALADYMMATFVNKATPPAPAAAGISGTQAHGGRERDVPAAAAPVRVDMSLPLPSGLVGDAGKGEKFYMDNCATCHGRKGDGKGPRAYFINPKPRNFLDEASRNLFNRPALYAAVSMGKVGTEMPAWKFVLTEQEMANVAEFVFRRYINPGSANAGK